MSTSFIKPIAENLGKRALTILGQARKSRLAGDGEVISNK